MRNCELKTPWIDEHWDIHEQVKGANAVTVRTSSTNSHINLYIHRQDQADSHVEIPYLSPKINILHTEDGVVALTL